MPQPTPAVRFVRRLAAIAGAAMVLLAAFGATPAQAASGGGCSTVYYHTWGHHYACISATGWGQGVADGYIQAYAGHPAADVTVVVVTPSGQSVASTHSLIGQGAVYFRLPVSFTRSSGSYRAVVNFRYISVSDHNAFSPYLNMP